MSPPLIKPSDAIWPIHSRTEIEAKAEILWTVEMRKWTKDALVVYMVSFQASYAECSILRRFWTVPAFLSLHLFPFWEHEFGQFVVSIESVQQLF